MHVIKSHSEKPADSTGPVLDFMGDKWAEGGCSDTTLLQCFDAAFKKKKKKCTTSILGQSCVHQITFYSETN